MSDYLRNIIAKNSSIVESIQPRLPSLFEPLHPFADSIPEIMESQERGDGEVVAIAKLSKSIHPTESKIPSASSPLRQIDMLQPEVDSNGERPFIRLQINRNQVIKSIMDHPIQNEPSIPRIKPTSLSSGHMLMQNTISVPGSDRNHPAFKQMLNPDLKLHLQSKTIKHNFSTEIFEPMPSVRVNIGRIEVRAIMPEPKKTSKIGVSAAPTLSLEEYMKQRDGGQR
jgi:hypothetical protein